MYLRTYLYCLFLVAVLLHHKDLCAQSPLVEAITTEQGLSQGFVTSLCQDKEGFMWFATVNGLNRYDGKDFQVFTHQPNDPYSLPNDRIYHIVEVGDNLVLTGAAGLMLYEKRSRRFYMLSDSISGYTGNIHQVEGDSAVWLTFLRQARCQLYRFSWPSDIAARLGRGEPAQSLVSTAHIIDGDRFTPVSTKSFTYNILWSYKGDPDWEMRAVSSSNPAEIQRQPIKGKPIFFVLISITPAVELQTCPEPGFYRTNPQNNGLAHWTPIKLPQGHLALVIDTLRRRAWIHDGNKMVYGIKTDHLPPVISPEVADIKIEMDELVISAFVDKAGTLWMSTNAKGLRKFNPNKSAFHNYLTGKSVYCPLQVDHNNTLWLTDIRDQSPHLKLNLSTGAVTQSPVPHPFNAFSTGAYIVLPDGAVWCINNLAPVNETGYVFFPILPSGQAGAPFIWKTKTYVGTCALYADMQGKIWIANHLGLYAFDPVKRKIKEYPFEHPAQTVSDLEKASDGSFWIGHSGGLIRAQPTAAGDTFQFTWYNGGTAGLPASPVRTILPDPQEPGIIWIGTDGLGMVQFDFQQNKVRIYNQTNGLPDNVIYGILADDQNNLWFSTNKGITKFNPKSGLFRYFFKSDGLQDNEFNTNAYGKMPDGTLLFGGVSGMTVFHPAEILESDFVPPVWITGLKVNNTWVAPLDSSRILTTGIEFTSVLELTYAQNSFTLRFASLDLNNPRRTRFRFYLEGAEPPWTHEGYENTAQYLNLAPGTYTFWVMGSNSSGVWNEKPTQLRITILAPWYRTWLAYFVYLLLVAAVAYYAYLFLLRQKLKQAETERLREMDAFKSRFFTNITHEFRTPLTIILGESENIESLAAANPATRFFQEKATLIRRNGQNLLRLINEILDLAKLENNTLAFNFIQADALPYLRYIMESLHSAANARNIMLRLETTERNIVMDYDPDRLLQIIYNLLSNAIKFTPSGGKVWLRANASSLNGRPSIEISVQDTGVGIPATDLPHIFDRFFQAQNQSHARTGGTGIGLSLTKELVEALGGKISVQSMEGQGTTFSVQLPVTHQAALTQQEISTIPPAATGVSAPKTAGTPADAPQLLLLEDNPDVVEYITGCLKDQYRLDFAYNGRAGIEKAFDFIPDIIVSDVMMPEKDGFEVCDTLKNDPRTSHIPIVLLTAKADAASRIAGLRRGADVYLAKPFHREELIITLQNLLQVRQKMQSYYAGAALGNNPPAAALPAHAQLEDAFLLQLRALIEQHISDPKLSLEFICQQMGMSRTNLYRKLTALTNLPISLFIRDLRLKKAVELLQTTDLNVSEVAFETGFDDPKYFSRVFSEVYGAPPSAFRKG